MKAIIVTPGNKGSARISDLAEPVPAAGQALLKVRKLGIDGTDLDINEGLYGEAPAGSDYLIAGHECLAIVEEVGGGVEGIVPGDLVVPTVRRPDDCLNCRNGESDMCLTGNYKEHGIKGLHGFAAEHQVTDAGYLVKVPAEAADFIVLLEPMSVAEKGVFQAIKIQERMLWEPKEALVLGAGPLGLLTTFLLRVRGMNVHTVATRSADSPKARLVERAGATYVNAKALPISSLGKYDLIVEETGAPSVATEALRHLNSNGVMCMLGIYPGQQITQDMGSLYTQFVLGNRVLLGSVNANRTYFEMGVQDLGQIQNLYPGILKDVITDIVPVSEYVKAYSPGEDTIKAVIDFE